MEYTKKNGLLLPKQRLFAPMLSTFGGGSARGFGGGGAAGGGGNPYANYFGESGFSYNAYTSNVRTYRTLTYAGGYWWISETQGTSQTYNYGTFNKSNGSFTSAGTISVTAPSPGARDIYVDETYGVIYSCSYSSQKWRYYDSFNASSPSNFTYSETSNNTFSYTSPYGGSAWGLAYKEDDDHMYVFTYNGYPNIFTDFSTNSVTTTVSSTQVDFQYGVSGTSIGPSCGTWDYDAGVWYIGMYQDTATYGSRVIVCAEDGTYITEFSDNAPSGTNPVDAMHYDDGMLVVEYNANANEDMRVYVKPS